MKVRDFFENFHNIGLLDINVNKNLKIYIGTAWNYYFPLILYRESNFFLKRFVIIGIGRPEKKTFSISSSNSRPALSRCLSASVNDHKMHLKRMLITFFFS
jgi:hypothetical protein